MREPPALPSREQQWEILLSELGSHREVREVAPGRIELREPEGDAVTVVVSPDQWERVLLDHAWADVEMYFDELIEPREEDETFVVFYKGDLVRSTREKLPPVRSRALERKIAAIRAERPDAQFGWYADPPKNPKRPPA